MRKGCVVDKDKEVATRAVIRKLEKRGGKLCDIKMDRFKAVKDPGHISTN